MTATTGKTHKIQWRALAAVTAMLLPAVPSVRAQQAELSDDQVRVYLNLALDNYPQFLCGDGSPCAPATAEEKANPPLTLAETRAILGQGIVSGVAEHCDLDWRGRSFLPMMTYFRQHEFKSERQMALIGGVHGIMQGQVVGVLAAEGPCTDELRQQAEQRLGPV
jgi:hypothetical protein